MHASEHLLVWWACGQGESASKRGPRAPITLPFPASSSEPWDHAKRPRQQHHKQAQRAKRTTNSKHDRKCRLSQWMRWHLGCPNKCSPTTQPPARKARNAVEIPFLACPCTRGRGNGVSSAGRRCDVVQKRTDATREGRWCATKHDQEQGATRADATQPATSTRAGLRCRAGSRSGYERKKTTRRRREPAAVWAGRQERGECAAAQRSEAPPKERSDVHLRASPEGELPCVLG